MDRQTRLQIFGRRSRPRPQVVSCRGRRCACPDVRDKIHAVPAAPEISGVNVVLRGTFNPAIFTPAWFALHDLLPPSAESTAVLEVAHPEITQFSFDWIRMSITRDRFMAATEQAPHVRLLDLVVRTFREHLVHTPLRIVGINREAHVAMSADERERLGRKLAPVEPWQGCDRIDFTGMDSGVRRLEMSQVNPAGRPKGDRINVTVQPSGRLGSGRSGVHVNVNDHYQSTPSATEHTARIATELLANHFEPSLSRSEAVIDHVVSLGSAS